MAPGPQPTYLDRVVMEIIETERTYVRDLRMIVEDYLAHIIETSELCLRPEQVCALFGNIEDIYEFNSELLQALDMCDHDPVAVARCFVLKSEYFEIYTQYCTNYPNSVAALTECMRNKSLAGFFRDRQASLKRSLPLGSYLLKPVQRILKYHLLLQEIAKHFDRQEDGYEVVEEAIFTMTGVAWYINDMKRKHEHAVRLQEVQSLLWNWTGSDLTTYGELVLEGTFKVQRGRKDRTLFLFDRMLLICKRRGEHYVYKTHISCSTLMFIESSKDSLSFSVAHYKQPKKAHSVQAKNLEEKKLWAHHIKRIILENHYAIIPQRAKEAILDLDSVQPPRFRYSPDRLKKALSCQSEEIQPVVQQPEGGGVSATRHDESSATEPTPDLSSTVQETPEPPQSPEPDLSSDLDPLRTLKPDGDSEPAEEPSAATPDSDSKTLSSGESSEDEEDDKEAEDQEGGASSILPSSVLDKASAIAQHFSGSVKRGSVPEDSRSPGFTSPRLPSGTGSSADWASPRLPSRTGSAVSLCSDTTDQHPSLSSVSSNAAETFVSMDLALLSPRDDDSVFDVNRGGTPRRRDSTLSKQDQLLIGKIRMYYENAGSQDATFTLRRRESLTYIPTGLVRSSVSRFDSVTQDQTTSSSPDPESEPQNPSGSIQHSSAEPEESTQSPDLGSERACEEEEFRPSSEMIRIWQAMERDLNCSPRDSDPHKPSKTTSDPDPTLSCQPVGGASDPRGGASDPSTVDSSSPRPKSSSVVNRTRSLKDSLNAFGAPGPRVVQLKAEAHEAGPGSDQNQLESKVLHLARQYSQRIKGTRPVVRQSPAMLGSRKTLACVVEEESPGKVNRTLPRRRGTQTTAPEPPALGLPCQSRGLSPGRPQSPHSGPQPVEVFDWPDVRELRIRYTDPKSPAVRTWSVPDQMGYSGPRRRSTSDQIGDGGPRRRSTSDQIGDGSPRRRSTSDQIGDGSPRRRSTSDQIGDGGPRRRLHRADSLDPRLCGLQEFQDHVRTRTYPGHYVAAEAPLPGDPDHKVLVLEKIPAETSGEDEDQDYVQIRSPTSREKISIMAVVDRCRVYQESDQSRTRAEPDSTEGEESPKTRGIDGAKHRLVESQRDPKRPKETEGGLQRPADTSGAKPDGGQQSLVKNLREKFQSLN